MNILAIGDVVGSIGCKFLRAHLPQLKKVKGVTSSLQTGKTPPMGTGLRPPPPAFCLTAAWM